MARFYDSRNNADIEGKVFDTDVLLLRPEEVARAFQDPSTGDYRRNMDVAPDRGSRL